MYEVLDRPIESRIMYFVMEVDYLALTHRDMGDSLFRPGQTPSLGLLLHLVSWRSSICQVLQFK